MRLVLLLMVCRRPAIAGLHRHAPSASRATRIRARRRDITLFGAGLLAVVLGVVCYRLMDDRPDVPLRADMLAAVRRREPRRAAATATGLFIVFEGGEGAGKSTQVAAARRLAAEAAATRWS